MREAAAIVRAETGLIASDPVAAIIAQRAVAEMQAFLHEDDPMLAALGEVSRALNPSPFADLAVDPEINSLGLFTEARVERLRARSGRALGVAEDEAECRDVWRHVEARLAGRYLRALRK